MVFLKNRKDWEFNLTVEMQEERWLLEFMKPGETAQVTFTSETELVKYLEALEPGTQESTTIKVVKPDGNSEWLASPGLKALDSKTLFHADGGSR